MVSATGILNNSTSLELSVGRGHNSLIFDVTNPDLKRSTAGLSDMPLLYPSAVQRDYIPDLRYGGSNIGGNAGFYQTDRGPFNNFNTTWDGVLNLTKTWGSHVTKIGAYYQNSFKPQSAFVSFNSQIDFGENPDNPYDTSFSYANAATGVYSVYTQASTGAIPEWRYNQYEAFLQDNWKATSKLTLDYGLRFYYMTPQWDESLQASNFLPDKYDTSNQARLYYPVCIGSTTCAAGSTTRRGWIPPSSARQAPTAGNTVEERFIGRVVAGTNQFNGSYQAGKGISDTLQSGNAFKVAPRLGFAYDVTGKGSTVVRGGAGIFYDRPMGNMVFGMITNAPGMEVSQLTRGRLQDMGASGSQGDPAPTVGLAPIVYDFEPPTVYAWNVGVQQKLWKSIILDVAYVGSASRHLLRQRQINSVPYGAKFLDQHPENVDPTTGNALPDDFLRPYVGYNNIQMIQYNGKASYNALQTSINRRFDNGLMFGASYVWSKSMSDVDSDYSVGYNTLDEALIKKADWTVNNFDRTHVFVLNAVYQTHFTDDWKLGLLMNGWQISGIYRWMSGNPYAVNFTVPGVNSATLTGSDTRNTFDNNSSLNNARVVITCDPGKGWSDDPYKQFDTSCFAPPQVGSVGMESNRLPLRAPAISTLDLSLGKAFDFGKVAKIEVRFDMFNALNSTNFTGVNSVANFTSLSDKTVTNLAEDANGTVISNSGFGSVNGVRQPRTLQLVVRVSF